MCENKNFEPLFLSPLLLRTDSYHFWIKKLFSKFWIIITLISFASTPTHTHTKQPISSSFSNWSSFISLFAFSNWSPYFKIFCLLLDQAFTKFINSDFFHKIGAFLFEFSVLFLFQHLKNPKTHTTLTSTQLYILHFFFFFLPITRRITHCITQEIIMKTKCNNKKDHDLRSEAQFSKNFNQFRKKLRSKLPPFYRNSNCITVLC